jgi:hypothetical protein
MNQQVCPTYPSLLLAVIDLSGPSTVQGSKKNSLKKCPTHSVHHTGPLGGSARDLGAPITYIENIDGGPLEAVLEIREHPPPMSKMSMVGPLGGGAGDLGVPTTYVEDINDGPPGRRCRRSRSTHHLCRRRQWRPSWEVVPEI